MEAHNASPTQQIRIAVKVETSPTTTEPVNNVVVAEQHLISQILIQFHAGYFRIGLSLCCQAMLWKTLREGEDQGDSRITFHVYRMLPSTAFVLLWSVALFTTGTLSVVYLLRCLLHFEMVKAEFLDHIGVNYLFAPWISWLLLLQSSPFLSPKTFHYLILWWVFTVPILALDVKIYGQWFTKGKRFLSMVANPTSQLSVIGNLAGSSAAAQMGWKEAALFLFSLGMAHYLVLFITLYQRLSGSSSIPTMLRPVSFLFIAAPSMASLAWDSISGTFDISSKMLFFLSLFLFLSLVSRPTLFKKSMRRYSVAWWAYSFPLSVLALASTRYAQEVKGGVAHGIMLGLSALSVFVSLVLMLITALNTNMLFPGSTSPSPYNSGSIE
ncbi:Transporter protein SLAC1/Mae1/ Ssu1/TehA [Dillenia turbinata]|uniref:Transporter protein SLAC1/Mae1/ Ssu1/TehA n=1 Tax=Dillenia turbinata TaxID=194707 RepID=A0AAN8V2G2_9MAGN